MRKFKLTNANGQTFDLMRKDAFFHDPSGLGWGLNADIMQVGDSYIKLKETPAQPSPSGEMVFKGYQQFEEFLDFIQVGGLVLGYMPLNTWQFLDVVITLGKSEIDYQKNRLICDISFAAVSQWYEALRLYQADTETTGGKVYPYSYAYTYSDTVANEIIIENGLLESYFRITIFGAITNPAYTLYQDNERIKSGRIITSIPEGNKLVIDSHPATMEIAEYTNSGEFVADRYGNSDFSTERIFELPKGQSRIVFTHAGVDDVRAWVEVRKRV